MLKRFFQLLLLIVSISVSSCSNESNVKTIDTTEIEYSGGHILPPSHLLDDIQPEASWIWDSGEINPRNYYLYVRKSFELKKSSVEARAFISAHAFAELYVNGSYVDRVPTNPDPEYQTYEEIDLAPYLRKGKNTIAALVYNPGLGLHHRMDARGGFFFQAAINDRTGKVTKVHSDESWRVAQALAWDTSTKKRQNDFTIGMMERYDARLAYIDWQEPSFDDSAWESATEIGVPPVEPWNQLVVVKRERLFYETLKPVSEWTAGGYRVFDFGKEITAFPRFSLTAAKEGVEIILGTGERLDSDSIPLMKDNVDYTDTYITREGSQSWKPLTWRGFRYMAIKKNPTVSFENISAEFRSFPVKRTGSFTCSDEELNQIWETGRWTMQLCAHDTWMDTPWREQTQYISGDTRYNIRYSVYAFAPNIKLLHDYNILSGAFSQRHSEEGAIRSRYPTGAHLGPTTSTYIPDYQLEWILMLHEYYMYYQDAGIVKQVYPNLKKLLHYFEGYEIAERGLVGRVPGWVVLDHPDTYKQDVDGENTAVNCLYYGALNSAAWIARNIMEDKPKATEWEQKAQAIKNSIQKYLWSDKDNAYKDGFESSRITQQTQVYALKYGLVPEDKKAPVVEFATSQGRSCEQSFSYWLLHTLFAEGEGKWALDYIRTYWGNQMNKVDFNGAWYEMWESPRGMTKSHAWCSGPTALLPEIVFGVEPLQPGWKQFRIKPCLYDLEWAEGVIPSLAGNISVKLRKLKEDGAETGLQIEAVVPEKTSAMIHIPLQSSEHFTIHVNDKLIWQDGQFTGSSDKVTYHTESEKYIVFEFQAGSYVIEAVDGTRSDFNE